MGLRAGSCFGLGGQVLREFATGRAGVIADPGGDLASEFGCPGPVAISGIAGLAESLVEADQRVAFLLARGQIKMGERVMR